MADYESLTKYLVDIENDDLGKWIIDRESKGTLEDPIQIPFVAYSDIVDCFIDDVYNFGSKHPEYELNHYREVLEANNIERGRTMENVDVSAKDGKCVIAMIFGIIRAERFCDGVLLSFFKNGTITKWLLRLKEIDDEGNTSPSM